MIQRLAKAFGHPLASSLAGSVLTALVCALAALTWRKWPDALRHASHRPQAPKYRSPASERYIRLQGMRAATQVRIFQKELQAFTGNIT